MKPIFILAILATALLFVSCDSTEEGYVLATEEVIEEIIEEVEEIIEETIEEIDQSDNIIDFTVVESIGRNMPPFTFRVMGEIGDDHRVRISTIIITDEGGALIQQLDNLTTDFPLAHHFAIPWADEEHNWGFSLWDYNFDGFLDMSLLRSEGGSSRNRPSYFWLWDAEAAQFVRNGQLMDYSQWSQMGANPRMQRIVTHSRSGTGNYYDGFHKYVDGEFLPTAMLVRNWQYVRLEIRQQIHPDMPPFWFTAYGEERGHHSTGFYTDINSIVIRDAEGEVIQQIDGLNTEFNRRFLERMPDSADFVLYFADFNFDGYLDMVLQRCDAESLRERPSYIWLWDTETGQFVKNQQLTDFSEEGIVRSLDRYRQVQIYRRVGYGTGREDYWYYEYMDGEFVWVATREFRRDMEQAIWHVELHLKQQIHPDMPPFSFSVEGQEAPSEFHGDLAFDLNSITIYDDNWNLIQRIDGLNTQLWGFSMRRPDGRFVLHFDDFNFDGYMDMALTNLAPNGIWNFGQHYYWLWNPEIGHFVQDETLAGFWGNLSLDEENAEVIIYERLGGANHFLHILQYIDGDFVHVRTINNTN